jgi:hypothetical protein
MLDPVELAVLLGGACPRLESVLLHLLWTILQLGAIAIYRQTLSVKINAGRAEDWENPGVDNVVTDTRYNLVFGIVAGQRQFYKGLLWYEVCYAELIEGVGLCMEI